MNDTTKVIAATESANPSAGTAAATESKVKRIKLTAGEREDLDLCVGQMVENLEGLHDQVQNYEGYRAATHEALHGIIAIAAVEHEKCRLTFITSAAKLAVKTQLKAKLTELGVPTKDGEHTVNMLLKVVFRCDDKRINRYASVLKAFAETGKPATNFLQWIHDMHGINGVLNGGSTVGATSYTNGSGLTKDKYYQAVTDDLVAGRSTPIANIQTSNLTGNYALVLAQRIDEGKYALIGSVDNLGDDAVPEVERFKQMIVSRKKAADKAEKKAAKEAEKAGKKQA